MEIANQVRAFITENFYLDDSFELKDKSSLLDTGVVASTGMLELIAHIEGAFDIEIDDDEMIPENLDSIASAADFVKKKLAEKS